MAARVSVCMSATGLWGHFRYYLPQPALPERSSGIDRCRAATRIEPGFASLLGSAHDLRPASGEVQRLTVKIYTDY